MALRGNSARSHALMMRQPPTAAERGKIPKEEAKHAPGAAEAFPRAR